MKNILRLATALIVGLCGCGHKSEVAKEDLMEISFENFPDSVRLIDYFKSISCVQLEMTDQSILGRIKNLVATEEEIIVLADNEITVFDKRDGKFLRQLGSSGEGPEEYIELQDIGYCPDKKCVIGYDRLKNQFIYYNIAGGFEGAEKSQRNFTWMESMERASDGSMLICNLVSDHNPSYAFSSLDSVGRITEIDPFAPIFTENSVATWAKRPMSVCGEEFKFIKIFSDTVFSIENGNISPLYKLNFRRELPTKETISRLGSFPGTPNFMSECLGNNEFTGVDKMFETSNLIAFLPHVAQVEGYYWLDKESGKGYYVESTPEAGGELTDVVLGKSIVNVVASTKEEIISCYEPRYMANLFNKILGRVGNESILPESVVNTLAKIDPEGNQFLFIYSH